MAAPRYIFDGRNSLNIQKLLDLGFEYEAVGRAVPRTASRTVRAA
jgi:hypothetical protein